MAPIEQAARVIAEALPDRFIRPEQAIPAAQALSDAGLLAGGEPTDKQIEAFRAWYFQHTGKRIFASNAAKAVRAILPPPEEGR